MEIIIKLTPEQEANLKATAEERGMTPDKYIETLVTGSLPQREDNIIRSTLSVEERIRGLDRIAERNRNLPVLPPEAYSREWLYADEDEELFPKKDKEE